ncbi:MAG: cupredoxin domain-containing protein, partial [Gammaproteobacteria bacterium]
EFESYPLNREKIITGNSSGVIYIGPLEAGEYDFFGDFHQDTAKGRLIAK